MGSEVPLTYGIVQYFSSDSAPVNGWFNGGLRLLAFKMKRLGYPFDCNVDIILCFSLFRSDFVEGILSARSINDLTTARLCILGWCDKYDI